MTTPVPSPRRRRRAPWIVSGAVLTVAGVLFVGQQTVSVLAHAEEDVTYTFPADGLEVLRVDNDTGSVEVLGADVDEVRVVAHVSHGLVRTDETAEVVGDRLVLDATCPWLSTWCDVHYEVVVPRRMALEVDLDNGRLVARDVDGGITADGDNGSIELVRVGGPLDVTTDNGRIDARGLRSERVDADSDNGRVHLRFAEAPRFVRATSDNGRVEVEVPDTDDAYRVEVQTDNGNSDTAVRTDPTSDRSILAETDNGDVSVHYPSG